MTSKAKTKGNSWEREIAKFLGNVLGGSFMRVPGSGAYIGASNVHRKGYLSQNQQRQSKGDISPPDNLSKMNIEAKNYKDINFHQILDGNCKQLNDWIEQTEMPADPADISFTIFKITRKGSWVVFKSDLKDNFEIKTHVVYWKNDIQYIITDYETFFQTNKEAIKRICAS